MAQRGRHLAPRLRRISRTWVIPLTLVMSLVMGGVAWADWSEGDIVGPEALSKNVVAGSPFSFNVDLYIRRQGQATDIVTWAGPTSLGSCAGVTGTGGGTLVLPSTWAGEENGTLSLDLETPVKSTVTISGTTGTAGSAGAQCQLTYTGTPADGDIPTGHREVVITVRFVAPTDTTPPVITPNVVGTLGNPGWYISNVTVSWDVVDNESAISSSSGCGTTTINTDTSGDTFICTATSAGGTNSASVTIKRDITAPQILDDGPTPAPSNGNNGWYVTAVSNQFSATDSTSGVAGPNPFSVSSGSSEGSAVTVASGPVSDNAGNTHLGISSAPFMIDLTNPTVTCDGQPQFLLNETGASVSATVSDFLSGALATSVSGAADTSSVGSKTLNLTGYDNAGLSTTATCNYSVIYDWDGFFRPIDNLPTVNKAKAGSAIPVKFSLGGDQGLAIFEAGFPLSKVSYCDGSEPYDTVETVTAGNSSLSYDALSGQYVYVWKTDKSWAGTCRQLSVKLIDGTSHWAIFAFTK